ncbi:MAG: lysylphosphatidylglycerol synthase transmembrane domain-containing protein [Halanaerobiales bacterium]
MDLTAQKIKRGIFISLTGSMLAVAVIIFLSQDSFNLQIFRRVQPFYMLLAAGITISFWLIKSIKLSLLVESLGRDIPFYRIFSIYLASVFVAHVTPSTSGGLPFQIYFLHREGMALGETTALTVLESMLNALFFLLTTPFLLFLWGRYLQMGVTITRLFYISVVVVVGFIIFSLFLVFNTDFARHFFDWILRRKIINKLFSQEKLVKFKSFLIKEIGFFERGLNALLTEKENFFYVLFYTFLYWGFYFSLAPILIKGLGVNTPLIPVILSQLVFNFIQPVIPTPGASGGAELSFAYFFKFILPARYLGVFVALWRFFVYYASFVVGGLFFINLIRYSGFLQKSRN